LKYFLAPEDARFEALAGHTQDETELIVSWERRGVFINGSQDAMARDRFQELPFLSSRRGLCGVVAVGISIGCSGEVPIRYFCPEFGGPSEILQGGSV